jgi:hypothetical protein
LGTDFGGWWIDFGIGENDFCVEDYNMDGRITSKMEE